MTIQVNMIQYRHVGNRHLQTNQCVEWDIHDINFVLCLYLSFDALPHTKTKPMACTRLHTCNVHLLVQVSQALDQLCKVEEAKT